MHIYLANYLEENQDGAISQKEFVDKKAMPLVGSIFGALDRDSNGIVDLSEAWMENILSLPFIKYLAAELFRFGDLTRDNFLSNEDIPRAIQPGLGHVFQHCLLCCICQISLDQDMQDGQKNPEAMVPSIMNIRRSSTSCWTFALCYGTMVSKKSALF